jgi:hypothetical protein
LCHELGQLDVDGGSKGGTKVSRARGDITEMVVLCEIAVFLDSLSGSAKSIKDLFDTSTGLHRNNSKLILLVDPDKEGLGIIMEDTSTRGPVSVKVASLKEPVTFFEEEVIIDELLLISL